MPPEQKILLAQCLHSTCAVTGLALIVQAPTPVQGLLAFGVAALASCLTRQS